MKTQYEASKTARANSSSFGRSPSTYYVIDSEEDFDTTGPYHAINVEDLQFYFAGMSNKRLLEVWIDGIKVVW